MKLFNKPGNITILIYIIIVMLVVTFFFFKASVSNIYAQVVINEFMVDSSPEWVELYNASDSAEYLRQYWLDDDTDFINDAGSRPIKKLNSINIDSLNYPYVEFNLFLNNSEDYVVIFDEQGNKIDSFSYTSNPGTGVAIGRYPDKNGTFLQLNSATKGLANSEPKPTPTPKPTNTTKPTSTPKPTKTPTPTKILTSTPTPKSLVKAISTKKPVNENSFSDDSEESNVLAVRDELKQETPTTSPKNEGNKSFPTVAGFFIVGGLSLIGIAFYPFIKRTEFIQSLLERRKKEYNFFSEEKKDT